MHRPNSFSRVVMQFAHSQFRAPGVILSWLDDFHRVAAFEMSGLDEEFSSDYRAIERRDPLPPQALIRHRQYISSFSHSLPMPGREHDVEIYRKYLRKYGFRDDLNFVLSSSDDQPIAILSSFLTDDAPMDAERLLGIQKFVESYLQRHPYSQFKARSRHLRTVYSLSAREVEIVELVRCGASNSEISAYLNISVATVKSHVMAAMSKVNAGSRLKLAAFCNQL